MKAQLWFCLILSVAGLFLSSWIVVPAPTLALLPLAVGAPEISPLLLIGNGVVLGVTLLQRLKNWKRFLAIACSCVGLLFSLLPILQLPTTVQQADLMLRNALGDQYLMQVSEVQKAQMRSHPFVLTNLLQGISIPTVQPSIQSFSTADATRLRLELYQPETAQLHPAIVAIYGGAWQRGEPAQNATFHRYMTAQGYTVIAISYRHAPQYQFPTQLQDVQAALQWVGENATAFKIDLNRVALIGWSAGAHLAMLAAYQTSPIPIRAVVSYYGPVNLLDGYYDPPQPDPINTTAVLETFLGGSPTQLQQRYEQASPIRYVKPGLPASLLVYGDRDHVVQSVYGRQLYNQLRQTDNIAVWLPIPWAEHAFDAVFRGLGNQVALFYTERFLAWALQ
ncbi:MAG TPA: alpha/beta hydrolase [Leptolyngbyaceae cyanobacterium M33_DOE_097]|uniref:Alpha/beta hydrolase n=1 Tax=Oscillatoriales cyanobacterium SpSt-418 TaxID=2282169 RepID=A0A7C3PEC8_9CYAN|nr:alpha/beta hydrolase [Leptolyngbyaceae cyanobacterium M33_DOE_097]